MHLEYLANRFKKSTLKIASLIRKNVERIAKPCKNRIHCYPCSHIRCLGWQCDTFHPFRKLVHHHQNIGVILRRFGQRAQKIQMNSLHRYPSMVPCHWTFSLPVCLFRPITSCTRLHKLLCGTTHIIPLILGHKF